MRSRFPLGRSRSPWRIRLPASAAAKAGDETRRRGVRGRARRQRPPRSRHRFARRPPIVRVASRREGPVRWAAWSSPRSVLSPPAQKARRIDDGDLAAIRADRHLERGSLQRRLDRSRGRIDDFERDVALQDQARSVRTEGRPQTDNAAVLEGNSCGGRLEARFQRRPNDSRAALAAPQLELRCAAGRAREHHHSVPVRTDPSRAELRRHRGRPGAAGAPERSLVRTR